MRAPVTVSGTVDCCREHEHQNRPLPRLSPDRRLPEHGRRRVMEVIHPRCCGMDISKRDAKVCVRIQHGTRATTTVTTWSSLSSKILELADHLAAERVSLVVIEATGDYWKPFYYLLEEFGLEVMLVNPRQARQIPGRKTDLLTELSDRSFWRCVRRPAG